MGHRLPSGVLADTRLRPGDYFKDEHGIWWIRPPRGDMGMLTDHTVTEHDDNTITVSPSILLDSDTRGIIWHGFLERGVWREA